MPDAIPAEPQDTAERTRNLQQRNVNGFSFQGTPSQLKAAEKFVDAWRPGSRSYRLDADYQNLLHELMGRFPYRGDTNFAKMDRIQLTSLEDRKTDILQSTFKGRTIAEWINGIARRQPEVLQDLINPVAPPPVE